MSDVKDTMTDLLGYMDAVRRSGSTRFLWNSVEQADADVNVIFTTVKIGADAGFKDRNTVSLNSLNRLRGRDWPMVFDNSALQSIFGEALARIRRLQQQVDQKEAIIQRVRRAVGGGW